MVSYEFINGYRDNSFLTYTTDRCALDAAEKYDGFNKYQFTLPGDFRLLKIDNNNGECKCSRCGRDNQIYRIEINLNHVTQSLNLNFCKECIVEFSRALDSWIMCGSLKE